MDRFLTEGKIDMVLSDEGLVATRKKHWTEGGYVNVERTINGMEKSVFRFYIKKSKKMDIYIGLR